MTTRWLPWIGFLLILLGGAFGGNALEIQAATDRSVVGAWQPPFNTPVVGIHAVVLPSGKVLFITGIDEGQVSGQAWIWTPPAFGDSRPGTFVQSTTMPANFFCGGHSALADGRIMLVGGHVTANVGINETSIFDPVTETWQATTPMAYDRWYPTSTTLPNGKILSVSGDSTLAVRANIPEVYNPGANTWTRLTRAEAPLPLYPWMFVIPSQQDIRVFMAGAQWGTKVLNVTTGTWEAETYPTILAHRGEYLGTAVTFEPGKILVAGGRIPNDPFKRSTNTAEFIDLTQAAPQWQSTSPMKYARSHLNSTLLPDGKVLVTGGLGQLGDWSTRVNAAELFDPATGTWTDMASMQVLRVYHSTAFLLPDGRVVTTGTNGETRFEIYYPPYLFKGARPAITALAPNAVNYGSPFNVGFTTPGSTTIAKVALVRLGAVTHSFNEDQRYVPLSFTTAGNTLTVQAPANGSYAPPGYYMLFIVNNQGVPSLAGRVKLQNPS